jgi:hypothetical protein
MIYCDRSLPLIQRVNIVRLPGLWRDDRDLGLRVAGA